MLGLSKKNEFDDDSLVVTAPLVDAQNEFANMEAEMKHQPFNNEFEADF